MAALVVGKEDELVAIASAMSSFSKAMTLALVEEDTATREEETVPLAPSLVANEVMLEVEITEVEVAILALLGELIKDDCAADPEDCVEKD